VHAVRHGDRHIAAYHWQGLVELHEYYSRRIVPLR
jgi:hypothetical protein